MARYIDANEAIQIIDNYAKAIDYERDICKVVIDAIKDIVSVICPTADVVEVVRCKDCKYSERYEACNGSFPLRCNNPVDFQIGIPENHFCSYGERR